MAEEISKEDYAKKFPNLCKFGEVAAGLTFVWDYTRFRKTGAATANNLVTGVMRLFDYDEMVEL